MPKPEPGARGRGSFLPCFPGLPVLCPPGGALGTGAEAGSPQSPCCSVLSVSANNLLLSRDLPLPFPFQALQGPFAAPSPDCCFPGPESPGCGAPRRTQSGVFICFCFLLLVFGSCSHIPGDPRAWTPTSTLTLILQWNPVLLTVVPAVRGRPAVAAASIPHPGNKGSSPPPPLPGQLPTTPPHPAERESQSGLGSWVGPRVAPQLPGVPWAGHL